MSVATEAVDKRDQNADARAAHGVLILLLSAFPIFLQSLQKWPLYTLVPLILYAVTVMAFSPLRRSLSWLTVGELNWKVLALLASVSLLSVGALTGWYTLVGPDLRGYAQRLPVFAIPSLALACLTFALVNATLEELIWRGVVFDALTARVNLGLAVSVQAVGFGLLHADGIPSGILGMAMATSYGVLLGILRAVSGGLFACIIAHVVADLTIFSLIVHSLANRG